MKQIEPLSILSLPNEILLKIIRRLPRHDIYFGIAHTNHRLRRIVQSNLKTLRLFDAHCHVHVVDQMPSHAYRDDGTDPIISYSFTLFDRQLPDYKQKKRLCLRGNDQRYKELHVTHLNDGTMHAQFERAGYDVRVPQQVAETFLSYMKVRALRFQVRKQCKTESIRIEDDFFANCTDFCERVCTRVEIKSLLLCSKNVLFPWQLGKKSLEKLSNLKNLKSLILENMTTFDPFSPQLTIPTSCLCSLQFRLDQRHRMDIENVTLSQINGSILNALCEASVAYLDFSAYSDVSSFVSSIDSLHMCYFISAWRSTKVPWLIRSISFNSTVTIDEFRNTVQNLLPEDGIMDIPYCRFRTFHKTTKNVVLELACYANGNATQWLLRTGYSDPPTSS
ncbi:unnamed protein product [Caenorhabditis bovis]|uniref:F-box domain-containing protein n=1 Tax=Caenorhabditis bovis TaxID=2654633 RepID=A0A8S1EW03_9PELO|nr:unnamed protein product [Caenorhabditis bovis]